MWWKWESVSLSILLVFVTCLKGILTDSYVFDEDFDSYEYMNLSVDPCDDFYEYTCGNFKNIHPLKDGQVFLDQFTLLEENLTVVVNDILRSSLRDDDPISLLKAKTAYRACVDGNYIDTKDLMSPEMKIVRRHGGFPILQPEMGNEEKTFGWNNIAEIASEFGISIFFAPYLYYDTQNASRNILRITTDAMDIPVQFRTSIPQSYEEAIEEGFSQMANSSDDTSEQTKDKLKFVTRTVTQMELLLRKFVLKLKRNSGSSASDEYIFDKVANISNFMKGIYLGGYTPNGTVVDPITNDPTAQTVTLKELNVWTKKHFGNIKLNWVQYVRKLVQYTYVDVDENFLVLHPYEFHKVLYSVINWVNMNDEAIVKSTALLRAFIYMASDSDTETRTDFETYLKAIGKTVYSRPDYCTRKIMDATGTLSLGLAVAYEYQLRYFDQSKIDSALQLITDLQSTFKEIIEEADWMDEESKAAAQTKANNIVTLLGFPEFVKHPTLLDRFYEFLQITSWDHYENARLMRAFQQSYGLSLLSKRDRKAWEKSPFDVNAYYNRQNNRIIFPVAMLNPIFFKGTNSLLDYGRIGMVIAHEITHGFDFQGFLYNPEGIIEPWWTNETIANFSVNNRCFVDQYSKYFIPEINSTLNSNNSLNENLADNGGLRTAFKALTKMLNRMRQQFGSLLRTTKFTEEQLFFVGYGTMWCNTDSASYLNDLKTSCIKSSNCHFVSKWRVNGVVSNMEEFSQAFSCPSGSPMNPENKCKLW